jgi:type IV pilus assembly protein PilV|tara:strand:+ start:1898 stop:2398 length:501 start_codon:yes stop_codon:yes gene_type:complete
MRRSRNRSAGVTIMEVLFSVLMLAVGVLGVSTLQAISLQQNRSALFRADALQLGNDILDRIRANPLSSYAPVAMGAAPSASKNCINEVCSRTEMAAFDIAQWKCSLHSDDADGNPYTICASYGIEGSIPQGDGSITLTNNVYEVIVQWVDDKQGGVADITLRTQVN